MIDQFQLSERHACRLLDIDRGSYRYEPSDQKGLPLKEQLLELARQKPRYGYRRLWALLVKRGHQINVKRVYRWYREEKLAFAAIEAKEADPASREKRTDLTAESGMGNGLRLRPAGDRAQRQAADAGRRIHARVSGNRSRRRARGCAGDASAGPNHQPARRASGASM